MPTRTRILAFGGLVIWCGITLAAQQKPAATPPNISGAWERFGFNLGQPTADGARRFADLTGGNVGNYLAVVLDGHVASIAQIESRIRGEGQIADAGKLLNLFVRNNPKNLHYLEATELMGDLLMAAGRFENAEKQYAELAKTPWPKFRGNARNTGNLADSPR